MNTTPSALNTALAEKICLCRDPEFRRPEGGCDHLGNHDSDCPAHYRPAVASALQSKDDSAALEIAGREVRIATMRALLVRSFLYMTDGLSVGKAGKLRDEIDAALSAERAEADAYIPKARAALQTDGETDG